MRVNVAVELLLFPAYVFFFFGSLNVALKRELERRIKIRLICCSRKMSSDRVIAFRDSHQLRHLHCQLQDATRVLGAERPPQLPCSHCLLIISFILLPS